MSDILLLFTNETQQQQQHLPTLPFDPALATFTPGMAKRATQVFATSPIVQGKRDGSGTGDAITFPAGSSILGSYFTSNFDLNQGSVCFRVTPEWDGNDGISHRILKGDSIIAITKASSNVLIFFHASGLSVSVSVAGWVAGTTYNICCRWDNKNTIDGTNYACISINDVHTFGSTTAPTPAANAVYNIGGESGNQNSNALIEGLTIFRRVLYDGTYGMDVNGGIDEVNLIAAGIDPTSLGGSWDVPFCLPTNQTAGALVSGTGEAWSHPWASNLLTDPWLSSYYGGGAWGVKQNATFTGYLDCGSGATLDDICAGGNIIQVETWMYRPDNTDAHHGMVCKGAYDASGWGLSAYPANPYFRVCLAGGSIQANRSVNVSGWHHYLGHYNDTTKVAQLCVDGIWGPATAAGSGAYVSDAAQILSIGKTFGICYSGTTGWVRIHNHAHYTPGTDFVPPRAFPGVDANTVEAWSMNQGTGNATASVTTPANDGVLTNAPTWSPQWQPELTPVLETSVRGGASFNVAIADAVSIQNLHDGAFTVEGWFNLPKVSGAPLLFQKGTTSVSGWRVYLNSVGTISVSIKCVTTDSWAVTTATVNDGRWHYIKVTFDDGGDRKARIYIDDVLSATASAGVGAVVSDVGVGATISNVSLPILGNVGWVRWSNSIRGAGMISRIAPPAPDANTMLQLNMTEGAGTAVTDSSGNGNNGTISGTYTWLNVPEMALDAPGARMFAWGMEFGSDAANDGIKQTLTGLVAATGKYVIRAMGFSGASGLGQSKIVVRDETNGADITGMTGDWDKELCRNGDFALGDTLWTKGTGWSIAAGVAHCDGTQTANSNLYQSIVNQANGGLIIGDLYKVTYTISNYAGGNVHSYAGALNSSAWRAADGTYTDYLRCATDTTIYIQGDADFIGDIDNVSVTRVGEYNHPDVFIFSFELPTVARGAGADCTSISVKLLNAAGAGVVYWHQCEMLPNLLDNPSLDTGAVADPFIPYGYLNFGLDAGDSAQETTTKHSAGNSVKIFPGATSNEGFYVGVTTTIGKYYSLGFYHMGVGSHSWGAWTGGQCTVQTALATAPPNVVDTASWSLASRVVRAAVSGFGTSLWLSQNTGTNYVDDSYLIALTDVSLTVTPASAANSLEGSGIRVDGLDSCTIPSNPLSATKGRVRFGWTPRHSAADLLKFGVSAGYIVSLGTDSNNVIIVYANAANHITLYVAKNSNVLTSDWNCTGLIVAGTSYVVELRWKSPNYWLYINGSLVGTVINNSDWIGAFPSNVFFGCQWMGGMRQEDAVFSAP